MPRAKKVTPAPTNRNPTYDLMGKQWVEARAKAGFRSSEFFYEEAKPTLVAMGLVEPELHAAAIEVCEAALDWWRKIVKTEKKAA